MTCFIARNMLSELVDDALDSTREGELNSHLAGCEACSRELAEIRRVRQMLRALPVHAAPNDFMAKVLARAERKSPLERLSVALAPLLRPRVAGGIAIAASVVLGVTVLLESNDRNLWEMDAAPGAPLAMPKAKEDASFGQDATLATLDKEEGDEAAKASEKLHDDKNVRAGEIAGFADPAPPPQAGAKLEEGKIGNLAQLQKPQATAMATATPAPAYRGAAAATPAPAANIPQKTATVVTGRTESRSTAPDQPGLYSSTPVPSGAGGGASGGALGGMAKDRSDADAREVARVPVSEPAIDGTSSGSPEPAFDVESSRRQRDAAKKEKASGKGAATAAAPAEQPMRESEASSTESAPAADELQQAEEVVVAESKVSARSAPATLVQARYESVDPAAPAKVLEVATGAGAYVITKSPPSLGKVGASTVVIFEIPAGSVDGVKQALAVEGATFDLSGSVPSSGKVRLRVEVVRK